MLCRRAFRYFLSHRKVYRSKESRLSWMLRGGSRGFFDQRLAADGASCATSGRRGGVPVRESPREVGTAVGSVVGGLTGQDVSEADLRRLIKDIQKDEEARSAVEAIGTALSPTPVRVRYCPVTGKHYSARVKICPIHNVPLLDVVDEPAPAADTNQKETAP